MNFGRLGALFGRLGAGGRASGLAAPVLSITSGSSDTTPDFSAVLGSSITTGDTIRIQIQVAGFDWSAPLLDTTHTITSGEASGHSVDLGLSALGSGSYDARAMVHHNTDSAWSNTVTFTISSSAVTYYFLGF